MIKYEQVQTFEDILSAFTALKNEFFSFEGDLAEFCKKIYNHGICFVGQNNEICAAIAFYANDTVSLTAFITSVLVSRNERGKGVATHLIKMAEDYCEQKQLKRIRLEVKYKNVAAISLYKKLGYRQVEERKDSSIMEKSLI